MQIRRPEHNSNKSNTSHVRTYPKKNWEIHKALVYYRTSIVNNSWPQGQQIIESSEPSYFYKKEFEQEVIEQDLKTEGI